MLTAITGLYFNRVIKTKTALTKKLNGENVHFAHFAHFLQCRFLTCEVLLVYLYTYIVISCVSCILSVNKSVFGRAYNVRVGSQ